MMLTKTEVDVYTAGGVGNEVVQVNRRRNSCRGLTDSKYDTKLSDRAVFVSMDRTMFVSIQSSA